MWRWWSPPMPFLVTPYAISLPLFSPPLIHAELPLSDHQQQRILQLLEF